MQLSDFDYHLPDELIALTPIENRSSSKLLVYDNGKISDRVFSDLLSLLKENDVLVFNDTKVLPAHINGSCKGVAVEITLIKEVSEGTWKVLAKPGKKILVGEKFIISDGFYANIISKDISGEIILSFNLNGTELLSALHEYGRMPLPPYIQKKRKSEAADASTYQTVYANDAKEKSVAAPTAGLHFTKEILSQLQAKNIHTAFVTLHVGAGTFFPVRVENILEHKMHSEFYQLDEKAANTIKIAKEKGGRVIAVGTTSLRVLETIGSPEPKSGETDIFIYPGYKFKLVDCLITNFHLPKSTLFMLVSAFVGVDEAKCIYTHAIAEKYRFFSYGDASFLNPSGK